jgi:hypothetical protein
MDYFVTSGQVFNRNSPSSSVNSSPVIDNTFHPFDFLSQVEMLLFDRTGTNSLNYVVNLSGGGGGGPAWKTFNVASTTARFPSTPMRSNDILSIAFDSANNVWMGSRDEGIFRFLGTSFEFLTTLRGLPSGSGTPVAPVQAMAFEAATGSMWVGTDKGLYKMRDSGSGFRVQSSFTTATPVPRRIPSDTIQSIAVRSGSDLKYVGTPVGLVRVIDGLTDGTTDDFASVILSGDVPAVAIDDNGNTDIRDDIVWVGFSDGRLLRSLLASEGAGGRRRCFLPISRHYTVAGAENHFPRGGQAGKAVDRDGQPRRGGVRPGGQLHPMPNLRDPFDFNIDGDTGTERSERDARSRIEPGHRGLLPGDGRPRCRRVDQPLPERPEGRGTPRAGSAGSTRTRPTIMRRSSTSG